MPLVPDLVLPRLNIFAFFPYSTSNSNQNGIENKGVDTSFKDSDDSLKAHLYVGSGTTTVSPYTTTEQPHSNSNSANGGSVNSQDSLWNVKSNGDICVSICFT